jgi:hypothetical protein
MDSLSGGSRPLAAAETVRTPYFWADEFLPVTLAEAMRGDIDAHFSSPDRHKSETHQVWNYWHVPDLYTYLRTSPEKVIDAGRIAEFLSLLNGWALRVLGLGHVAGPYLSLYVNGCQQNIHNDSTNGRISFVYSLTRNDRKSAGGKTLLFHERDPFRKYMRSAAAGAGFCSALDADFNRLILFDDRLPHGVSRVEGSMDPLEGRFVLHGHISEAPPFVEGPLPPEAAMQLLGTPVQSFFEENPQLMEVFHGPLTVRVVIGTDGAVRTLTPLLDRVFHTQDERQLFEPIAERLLDRISSASAAFPTADTETTVIFPILFGGVLERLRGLERGSGG